MKRLFWFRKDLRVGDHPALNCALDGDGTVYVVATADQLGSPFNALSDIRKNSLRASWASLSGTLDGKLCIIQSPSEIGELANKLGVTSVYVSEVFDTLGLKELGAVESDLDKNGVSFVRGPGNYAVRPGTVRKEDGNPYRVYTPFYKEWSKHLGTRPFATGNMSLIEQVPAELTGFNPNLSEGANVRAGESFALETLGRFLDNRIGSYHENRNRADLGSTSHLSHALSHGEIHPRTIIARLPDGPGAEIFTKELAWREFYADVLFHHPDTLDQYLDVRFAGMRYDYPGERFEAWKFGKTGYPMVDAGMRQLLETGWVHNRVRMIVASFLVKDLHIEWQHGAKWFEENLTDYDPASNSHGWQWTAGCGTDASPYFRIFNPVMQGLKFDPNGDYVRKFVPELRHLKESKAHEPWDSEHGYSLGYPKRIIDHAVEREESLARLAEIKKP